MLRKVSILGLVIVLLISVMSGCISTGYLNEESSIIEEQPTTTPVTTTPVNKDAISAQLAQFTNEDGTGIISLEMTPEEISRKLDEYQVPYQQDSYGSISTIDGSFYVGGGDDAHFKVMQTKSGLKVGDSLSRVVELYGQPDEINENTNAYIYYTGKTSYDRPIDFTVKGSNNIVDSITISVRPFVAGMEN